MKNTDGHITAGTSKMPLAKEESQVGFSRVIDFEAFANRYLPRNARDYYRSGANDEITLHENRRVFADYYLMPRIRNRPWTNIDLTARIQGVSLSLPVAIAPWAMQKMAHPDGECATARAAQRMRTVMTLSTVSTISLEEVAKAAFSALPSHQTPSPLWFQLYVYNDRTITESLIDRAVAAGYSVVVVTVDTPVLGRREADVHNRFHLPTHLRLANLQGTQSSSSRPVAGDEGSTEVSSALEVYFAQQIDASLTWESIVPFIRACHPQLKIVLKGIMAPEDAYKAVHEHHVDAVWVSNHGGRQLDSVPATLSVLREIVSICRGAKDEISSSTEVYVDGGFTCGVDIIKASLR